MKITIENLEGVSENHKRAVASLCAEKQPRLALTLWQEMDFKVWDRYDGKIMGEWDEFSSLHFTRKKKRGMPTPIEVFAEKGMEGPFRIALRACINPKNYFWVDYPDFPQRLLCNVIKGFEGESFIRVLKRVEREMWLNEEERLTRENVDGSNDKALAYLGRSRKARAEHYAEAGLEAFSLGKVKEGLILWEKGQTKEKKKSERWHLMSLLNLNRPQEKIGDPAQLSEEYCREPLRRVRDWPPLPKAGEAYTLSSVSGSPSFELLRAGGSAFFAGLNDLGKAVGEGKVEMSLAPMIALLSNLDKVEEKTLEVFLKKGNPEMLKRAFKLAMGCLAGSGLMAELKELEECAKEKGVEVSLMDDLWPNGPSALDVLAVTTGYLMESPSPFGVGEKWNETLTKRWCIAGLPKPKESQEVSFTEGKEIEGELRVKGINGFQDHPSRGMALLMADGGCPIAMRARNEGVKEAMKNGKGEFAALIEKIAMDFESVETNKKRAMKRL